MRRVTAPVREATPPAVHASPAGPITWAVARRTLLVATIVGVFLCLLIVPGFPTEQRLRMWGLYMAFSWVGSLLGMASVRTLALLRFPHRGVFVTGTASGLLMFPFMSVFVWAGISLATGRVFPTESLPELLWQTALICVGASSLAVMAASRTTVVVHAKPPAPKFLARLPLKLRGGEVWAVEAEDHYLRLHTSKGQDLILMRLADAVAELEGIEGMQVHRSWWVARDAITDARRGDGRATLTLKDGSEVPVSRTYAAQLREKGWV